MRTGRGGGRAAALPFLWLVALFLAPFAIVLKLSLSHTVLAMPPYAPQFDAGAGLAGLKAFLAGLNLDAYRRLASDHLYVSAYLSSLGYAAAATGMLLLVGYPMAYGMARCSRRTQAILLPAVLAPFWTIYAWIGILKPAGLLNAFLSLFGIGPVQLLDSNAAVYIGLVYAYLPFMVLPLYAALERQDASLLEAAADLGASRLRAFWTVTAPMSLPAVGAGAALCFIPMVGEFVVPDLLGGSRTLMIGKVVWGEFFDNRDWPTAAALSIALLLTLLGPIVLFQRWQAAADEGRR
jgi:putrescine transport system permease protein